MKSLLEVTGLEKVFRDTRAVGGLSFGVKSGEIVGLVGPNGAGKTTTLRCAAGVIPPTYGSIRVGDHDLVSSPVEAKRQIAFLADEPHLFDHLTAWEHLNFFARLYGVEDWERKGRDLLLELDLAGKEDGLPAELSRGMKQKLSIACAFLHAPRLILLDEPLTGLDPLAIRGVKRSLASRAAAGAAVVLSSHLLTLVEELCHRVLIVDRGRIVAEGTVPEIRALCSAAADAPLEELFLRITTNGAAA